MRTKIRAEATSVFATFVVIACSGSTDGRNTGAGGTGGHEGGEADGGYSAGSSVNIPICPGNSLPAGGCASDGMECKMAIGEECANGTAGAVNYWQCSCKQGAWQCEHTGGNTAVCGS